jgi:hypothetical protein
MRDPDEMATCPICGEECNEYYINTSNGNEIVGCDRCIDTDSAWERSYEDEIGRLMDKGYDEWRDKYLFGL